jgi:Spy/CpxP family protein refolding chaperone
VRTELNLTDEQVGRLHKLAVESEKSSIKTRAELQLHSIELRELLRAEKPEHDAIMSEVQQISNLRGQMAKQHMETLLAARDVLTPEQLKKVRSFMENRGLRNPGGPGSSGREHMMERHGGQGRPSGRPGGGPGAPASAPTHTTNPAPQ